MVDQDSDMSISADSLDGLIDHLRLIFANDDEEIIANIDNFLFYQAVQLDVSPVKEVTTKLKGLKIDQVL